MEVNEQHLYFNPVENIFYITKIQTITQPNSFHANEGRYLNTCDEILYQYYWFILHNANLFYLLNYIYIIPMS